MAGSQKNWGRNPNATKDFRLHVLRGLASAKSVAMFVRRQCVAGR